MILNWPADRGDVSVLNFASERFVYLFVGTGIIVAGISIVILKSSHAKFLQGKPIQYEPKPIHTGVAIGGTIFGDGWANTGACPCPIYAQIGSGRRDERFDVVHAVYLGDN